MRQARNTLTLEKLALLTKLDAKILDLTDEHALETEVLQADDVKERLTLALIDIADALGSDQDGKDKTGYDIYATGRTHSPDHGSRCDSRDSTVTPRLVSAANPTPSTSPVASSTIPTPSTTSWFSSSFMTGLEHLSLSE